MAPTSSAEREALADAGWLRERATGFVPVRADDYPAARVALRSASADSFALIDVADGEVVGTIEAVRAYSTVHEGAIYLHMGRSYLVRELDLAARRALLEPATVDYFTQAKRESMTYIERLFEQRETHGVTLSYGAVVYTETVLGYQRKGIQDHAVIDFQTLDLPTTEFSTRALWYELDDLIGTGPAGGPAGPPAGEAFPLELLLGSLHALEHAQIAVLPLIAMCDRWDIGGLSTNAHPQTGGPTIFIYDGHPGGIGITRRGYEQFDRLVADAQRLIGECPCADRLPLVRAVAEVRQPQRPAVQARRARTARSPHSAPFWTELLRPRFVHQVERRLGDPPEATEAGVLEHLVDPRLAGLRPERQADLLRERSGGAEQRREAVIGATRPD